MKYVNQTLGVSFFLATFALVGTSTAAVTLIDSITSTGDGTGGEYGTMTSLTFGSTTSSSLFAPSSVTSSSTLDALWIDGTSEPTTALAATGGLDLDNALLNEGLTVQFGRTVTDIDAFFILNNQNPDFNTANGKIIFDSFTLQAINSSGTVVGSALNQGAFSSDSAGVAPKLVPDRTFNRTGATTLPSREFYGVVVTLADLGLAGNTSVTGFTLSEGTLDPSLVGLATVPEPAASSLLIGLGGMLLLCRRRRR